MKRRSFFRFSFSALLFPVYIPQMLRVQLRLFVMGELPADERETLREVANIVLPSSLGRSRTDEIGDHFVKWVKEYRAGAQMDSGYGFTRLRVLPPTPARRYAEQLREIEASADKKGARFGALDGASKRAIVEAALREANVTDIPSRPNGKHIATDLMSYFFNSSVGRDLLYDSAIQSDSCRGLPDSEKRPARLS